MNKLLLVISGICIAGCLAWMKTSTPKVAFVKTAVLLDGFNGMKEASSLYQKKHDEWQSNIDSLKASLQSEIKIYNRDSLNYSAEKKIQRRTAITRQRDDLVTYMEAIDSKAKEEDQKMTMDVMNQINSFIQQYGHDNGYTMIMGTTSSGNLLYGEPAADITDAVLLEMNKYYSN